VKALVPSCITSRIHSLAVVVQKSLLNRARQQAEEHANFCNLALEEEQRLGGQAPILAQGGARSPSEKVRRNRVKALLFIMRRLCIWYPGERTGGRT
jgi:hypothetical protein